MQFELIYQDKKIVYRVTGKGKPVLLLHGFGETAEVWEQQVRALESSYTLIIPDLPGTGGSDLINDMSMEGLAEVVRQIIDRETGAGDVKPVLLGHSMGGYITMAFVEKYEDKLAGFGLIHSTSAADSDEKKETRRKGIRFIKEHGPYSFLENSSPNLFSEKTKKERPELLSEFLKPLKEFSATALISYYEGMMARKDRANVLKNTKLPVLFVFGEDDSAIPLKEALKQTTYPEKAYIHVLKHSGHLGMLEESGKLNEILLEYLQDL